MSDDFNFLDDLITEKKPPEEKLFTIDKGLSDKVSKELLHLTNEVKEELLNLKDKKKLLETKKTFSQLDMEAVLYNEVKKNMQYSCIITFGKQVLSQDKMPLLYHKDIYNIALETAKELNGSVMRADKAMEGLRKLEFPDNGKVILVHKAKSAESIMQQERIKNLQELKKNRKIQSFEIRFNTGESNYIRDPNQETIFRMINQLKEFVSSKITTSQKEDFKFIVFPAKYLTGDLEAMKALGVIERCVDNKRAFEGKKPIAGNKYIVCNQDEPYAEEVWQVILQGEDLKLKEKK